MNIPDSDAMTAIDDVRHGRNLSRSFSTVEELMEELNAEEIEIIEQMQLLDLFEQKLAPIIYNQALDDAKKWYMQMMDNLDADYYALYKNEN